MISLVITLGAAAVAYPQIHKPWRVEAREPICTMGAVFASDARISIEYHPRSDRYHMLIGGIRWGAIEQNGRYKVKITSGRRSYETTAKGVRQPGTTGAFYLPLTDPRSVYRPPLTNRGPPEHIEGVLWLAKPIVVEIDGKQRLSIDPGQSRKAFIALVACSQKYLDGRRSMASYRLEWTRNVFVND